MEDDEDITPAAAEPKKSGVMGLVIALLVTTGLGIGGGAVLALNQVDTIAAAEKKKAIEAPRMVDDALAWSKDTAVVDLDPVIANLASPSQMWIRLETAIIFNKDEVSDVARLKTEVTGDILAFVRTVTVGELQGASALNHLRDDLNERVRFQTAGAVEELIIEAMVLQ